MKKRQCIIFVLKNEEYWLIKNIEKIIDLGKEFDLFFVIRESEKQDRIIQVLKLNNLISIPLSYDSGYYEALRTGFEFVQNLKYNSWIEFGECDKINLNEIKKLNSINKDYELEKSIIFCSRYSKKNRKRRYKKYIYLATGKKISDPYSRFRIYNYHVFEAMKYTFSYKMQPQNFVSLLSKKRDFIEVRVKSKKIKKDFRILWKQIKTRFKLFIYTIFFLGFNKKKIIK